MVGAGELSRSEQSGGVCMDAPDSVNVLLLEPQVRTGQRAVVEYAWVH